MPSLLAFGWMNLPMLGWLAAAAIPLLIHFWRRRRYQEQPWAAMPWLRAAVQRQSRRLRFEQWFLLVLRTLLIVLVVTAVAQPFFEQPGASVASGNRLLRILVLDDSYSMGYKQGDKSLFEQAKDAAQQIVRDSCPDDAFALLLMSSPPRIIVETPLSDHNILLQRLQELRPTQTTANLPAVVPVLKKLLDQAAQTNPELDQRQVFFITDLQRITWNPVASTARDNLRQQAEELARVASFQVVALGPSRTNNLAISQLRTVEPLVIANRDTHLQATVNNFSAVRAKQDVELRVDGRLVAQQQVDIPPKGSATVEFLRRFDTAADYSIEVTIPGDPLEVDNHRFLVVPVQKEIRILCIDGRPSGKAFGGAADFLTLALSPQPDQPQRDLLHVETAGEIALLERNLRDFGCLFLCNVAQFTVSEAKRLDAYLRSGGSVIFFLGDQVQADRYNNVLGIASDRQAGQGRAEALHLLPAQLRTIAEDLQNRLDPLGYQHPLLNAFRGRNTSGLLTTPIFKYYRLATPQSSAAKTVLALPNGDPLIVEQPVHRGHVVLVATSADTSWSALPLAPHFVPLARELALWCAASNLENCNGTVGQPLDTFLPNGDRAGPLHLQLPDGHTRLIQPSPGDSDAAWEYATTGQSGIYVAQFAAIPNRSQTFAINLDTSESDLARATPDDLQTHIWPGITLLDQDNRKNLRSGTSTTPSSSDTLPLHVTLLYTALMLLFLETLFAWRFGHHRRYQPESKTAIVSPTL